MPATSCRITVTVQALNEAGESVGDAAREELTIPVPSVATFDPAKRVVAMRARDLGERAAVAFRTALETVTR
jgi:hypothetical protein